MGTAVAQWLRCCATNRRSLVRLQMVSLEFLIDIKSFRSHYGPGVDSACNRNEYQEHFLGEKSGRCVRLTTLPPSCAVVMKSGNLNFLEPSGQLGPVTGLIYFFFYILVKGFVSYILYRVIILFNKHYLLFPVGLLVILM